MRCFLFFLIIVRLVCLANLTHFDWRKQCLFWIPINSILPPFFLFQALEAISEVGDLLQLKYSRREPSLPSLGWMSEESLLQDWATSSSPCHIQPSSQFTFPPSHYLFLSNIPHFPLSQSLHPDVSISLHIRLQRTHQNQSLHPGPSHFKTCTLASLISLCAVCDLSSFFTPNRGGPNSPTSFCVCCYNNAFRAFQFVLTYCDSIGLTSSLILVCTLNVYFICAIITTTWSFFVKQPRAK